MKKHWREWFAIANSISWLGVQVGLDGIDDFKESGNPNSTECMYQAFKARLIEETKLEEKMIEQKAFESFMLALREHGTSGLGYRKCLEAYEAAKEGTVNNLATGNHDTKTEYMS